MRVCPLSGSPVGFTRFIACPAPAFRESIEAVEDPFEVQRQRLYLWIAAVHDAQQFARSQIVEGVLVHVFTSSRARSMSSRSGMV